MLVCWFVLFIDAALEAGDGMGWDGERGKGKGEGDISLIINVLVRVGQHDADGTVGPVAGHATPHGAMGSPEEGNGVERDPKTQRQPVVAWTGRGLVVAVIQFEVLRLTADNGPGK